MTKPVVNEKDRAAENGASRSQQRVVGVRRWMVEKRFGRRCKWREHGWYKTEREANAEAARLIADGWKQARIFVGGKHSNKQISDS